MPAWRSRRHMFSSKIMVLMAGAASQTGNTLAFAPAADVHRVPVTVVSLPGKVSARMAVHAARMPEHRHNRFKGCYGRCMILMCRFGSDVRAGFLLCVCCNAFKPPSACKPANCKSKHHDPGAP